MNDKPKVVNAVQLFDWQHQATEDALAWVKAKTPFTSERELMAYGAGHAAGWRDAISTLKLHGIIKASYGM